MSDTNDPNATPDEAPTVPTPPAAETTPAASEGGTPSAESRQWAMISHLSALVGFLIPFGNLIGPLVVWQVKKADPFVDAQGKEALNFQITITLAGMICAVLTLVLIGFLLLPALAIVSIVLIIIAAIRSNEGENYVYPFAIRLVK